MAYAYGALCHSIFAIAVLAMIAAMYFGMSQSLGRVPQPWSHLANAGLLVQFPIVHSFLLTDLGRKVLIRLAPRAYAETLTTTTFAVIAAFQLAVLFVFWTPSGVIFWQAAGSALWLITAFYAATWLMLIKASYDAGPEVQSGALGWMSLAAKTRPIYPDMPVTGLFRIIRQPIYVSFALTLWAVPTWTPDQVFLATTLTIYCVIAPRLKERRFAARYGARFAVYRDTTPYMVPRGRFWRGPTQNKTRAVQNTKSET